MENVNLAQMVQDALMALKEHRTHHNNGNFVVADWEGGKHYKGIQEAVGSMSKELRKTFIIRLVQLWGQAYHTMQDKPEWKELQGLFGEELDHFAHCVHLRLVFTLTPADKFGLERDREFRCWYGYPCRYLEHHVDGADSGMLFSLKTHYSEIRAILDEV
jgi:hypothetical protein